MNGVLLAVNEKYDFTKLERHSGMIKDMARSREIFPQVWRKKTTMR